MFSFIGNQLLNIFVFVLGLVVGSFLNCLIHRLATEEEFIRRRSYCPCCQHQLAWYDLIPVASFLFLRGKCRYCRCQISWQYPLVEIATALLFLLIFSYFSSDLPLTIYYLLLTSLLIVIFVYDLKHYLIPDSIIYLAIAIAFLWRLFQFIIYHLPLTINEALLIPFLSALGAAGFFAALVLISKEKWMGWGDVFLAFLMGLSLGFPDILLALFLAFTLGALIGLGLVFFGKKKMKSQVPFGPFLILATLITFFYGKIIISWYLGLFIRM